MKNLIAITTAAIAIAAATPADAQSVNCVQNGTLTMCSNGQFMNQFGPNQTFYGGGARPSFPAPQPVQPYPVMPQMPVMPAMPQMPYVGPPPRHW